MQLFFIKFVVTQNLPGSVHVLVVLFDELLDFMYFFVRECAFLLD